MLGVEHGGILEMGWFGNALFRIPSWPGKSAKRVFALDDPGTHALRRGDKEDVDGRVKPGHDDVEAVAA
jgi:hypothetical protein